MTCHCGAPAKHVDAEHGPLCRWHWVRAARAAYPALRVPFDRQQDDWAAAAERAAAADPPAGHGTPAGYARHYQAGERPCPSCRAWHTQQRGYARFRRGSRNRPAACPRCASVFLPAHDCHMGPPPAATTAGEAR